MLFLLSSGNNVYTKYLLNAYDGSVFYMSGYDLKRFKSNGVEIVNKSYSPDNCGSFAAKVSILGGSELRLYEDDFIILSVVCADTSKVDYSKRSCFFLRINLRTTKVWLKSPDQLLYKDSIKWNTWESVFVRQFIVFNYYDIIPYECAEFFWTCRNTDFKERLVNQILSNTEVTLQTRSGTYFEIKTILNGRYLL